MRKLSAPRTDAAALSHVMLAVVVAIIVVLVAVAVVVMAGKADMLDGNKPTKDTIAVIECTVKIGDFDNQWGQVEARDVAFTCTASDYEGEEYRIPGLRIASFWKNEFDFKCQVRCTGPNGFDATAYDKEHVEVDEWDWGKRSISFDSLRFFVEEGGTYTLVLKIYVDAEDEGLENELVASRTTTVVVD